MENKIEHLENKSREVYHELFFKNHKTRLQALLTTDASKLSTPAQKQHQAKIKYLESVIETVEGMQEIISGMVKAYRNNLLTSEQKLKIMEAVNPKLNSLIERFDCELKN